MYILLVEDDTMLGEGICTGLRRNTHVVDWVKSGEKALLAISNSQYDATILDIGLPGISGLDVLNKLRKEGNNIPILILTAQDTLNDRVRGLDRGADDYLTKPFEFDELSARLRAITRRSQGISSQTIQYGNITIDSSAHSVCLNDEKIELSRREFAILEELVSNAGRVLSKPHLEEKIYGWSDEIESNTIEVYIHHLRKKLGQDLVKTIRGVGYIAPKI